MKNYLLAIITIFSIITLNSCNEKEDCSVCEEDYVATPDSLRKVVRIRVGVFDRNGDSPMCIVDAVEALKIDPQIIPTIVSAADIMSGNIDHYDVVIFPGGGGKSETNSLGEKGIEKCQEMVKSLGKGIVGICAGAYILTDTPNYPSLALSGYKAIDIEHDHRGNGLVKFSLTKKGKEIFPEIADRDISFCQYYEGPVLVPADTDDATIKGNSLATMLSDVHLIEGTPANMTNNKPFVVGTEVGEGRTISFVGHPESTPGMRWMLPRAVRWVAKKKLISYGDNVVRPDANTTEILYNKAMRKRQRILFNDLFSTPEKKISAIREATQNRAWSAKKWFSGLLRDSNPQVREEAAKALLELERTDAIYDIHVAINNETDLETERVMTTCMRKLSDMVGNKDLIEKKDYFVVAN